MFASGDVLERDEAIRRIARELDYARTGARIHERLDNEIRAAVRRKIISNERGNLVILCRSITDYYRDELIDALLSAMGRAWIERNKAIRLAARHLGFKRTGSAIRKHFKSVINGAIRRGLLAYEGTIIRKI